MEINEFTSILTTFADSPADIDLSKGKLMLQFQNDIIEAKLEFSNGSDICIIEGGSKLTARDWIIKRLARLPLLAERILSYVKVEDNFVTPKGIVLDQLENNPEEKEKEVEDALLISEQMLEKRIPGAASILYLTSDAGEGKTTLINQLARNKAKAYKNKKTDWLLIPIPLAGRPFLRFDDIVIGAIVNGLRFQMLYYDSFVELVRLGVIVPAFDGFEEMFVESGTGEAVSALGNLVRMLKSSGNILISARKAYFEYKSFETQSRLFDSIGTEDVVFARLGLKRWDREKFLDYCEKRKVIDGEKIYEDVSKRFNSTEHPLLTRAVLVRRLLDIAADKNNRQDLLRSLGNKPHEYFSQFIIAILKREVNEKWIDRSGADDAAKPLLSIEEHKELLSNIAQEMWINSTNALREDLIDLITELFCDKHSKNIVISRQVKERIKQHALLIRPQESKPIYTFDHDDFRNYFLGRAIGRLIARCSASELRTILQIGLLSSDALETAIHMYRLSNNAVEKTCKFLLTLCATDSHSSYARENIGGLVIRFIHGTQFEQQFAISNICFPPNALATRQLSNIHFKQCYFQPTTTDSSNWESCKFENCTIEKLELTSNLNLRDVLLLDNTIISIIPTESDITIFAPEAIEITLRKAGFTFPKEALAAQKPLAAVEQDLDLILAERAFRRFLRSTNVSKDVLKAKMGINAHYFINNVLPQLTTAGILKKQPKKASTPHYRLAVPMQDINMALVKCDGSFSEFISILNF